MYFPGPLQSYAPFSKEQETCTTSLLFSHKNMQSNALYSNMDGPRDYHSEVRQTEKEKDHITYMWNLIKMVEKNLFIKQKETHRFQNQSSGYHRWNHCGEKRI